MLRLFLGGLGQSYGGNGNIPRLERRCCICNGEAPEVGWISPSATTRGVAWCGGCAPGAVAAGHGWACAATLLAEGDPAFRQEAASILDEHGGALALRRDGIPLRTGAGCPLCQLGEFGSEHLLRWCPAVARAWSILSSGHKNITKAIRDAGPESRLLVTYLHQVSYLANSLNGHSSLDWAAASGALVRATRAAANRGAAEEDGPAAECEEYQDHAATCVRPWQAEPPDCQLCAGMRPTRRLISASARPSFRAGRPALAALRKIWPTASADIQPGHTLATLHGWHERGAWPFRASGWWPRPGKGSASLANAAWETTACPRCFRWNARLFATRPIPPKEGIVTLASDPDPILGPADDTPYEATFDGATIDTPAGRAAGAAAILLGPPGPDGVRPVIGTYLTALPAESRSEVAEAWGARAAARAAATQPAGRVAIAGDNPGVVRYCAGTGNLTSPNTHEVLDHAIAQLASQRRGQQWILIPRALNKAAHEAARRAAARAANLLEQGSLAPTFWQE